MNKEPLVSVIIIFLNAERFIEEAVESVFAQSYKHWELLLVDDGTTDRSTDLARAYATRHPQQVRYLEHEGHQNLGMSAARNLGLSCAQGEYVAFLDADDLWMEEKLARQVAILNARPEIDMVYGNTQFWQSWTGNPEDQQRDNMRGVGIEPNTLIKPPALLTRCFPLGDVPSPTTCSMLVRRKIIEQVGGFEPVFRGMYEDQAFLAKLYLRATIFVTSECWDKYRVHPDSCVSVSMKIGQHHAAKRFFLNWLEEYLSAQRVSDAVVWRALQKALWPYRHPFLHSLSESNKHFCQQVGRLKHATKMMKSNIGRLIAQQSTGKITAYPNPVLFSGRFPVGMTTLSWEATGATAVEVRIDAPDGPLFSRSGPVGSTQTGLWVSDGMTFYLQDVSGGLSLAIDNTLATVRVKVVQVEDVPGKSSVVASAAATEPTSPASILQLSDPEEQISIRPLVKPPIGEMNFGDLRRITPISREWGFDRGRPIDRYYIENFLALHSSDVRGRVLEIGDSTYTRRFGADRVTRSDVLHLIEGHPQATIIGDLTSADHIPSDVFDCLILTQTIQLIYDVRAAIRTLYRILKPRGVLLATFPGLSQIAQDEWTSSWCWGFTQVSTRRLFEELFPSVNVQVEAYGNVLAVISFLHGLAAEELSPVELDHCDPGYSVSLTVRAVKPAETLR